MDWSDIWKPWAMATNGVAPYEYVWWIGSGQEEQWSGGGASTSRVSCSCPARALRSHGWRPRHEGEPWTAAGPEPDAQEHCIGDHFSTLTRFCRLAVGTWERRQAPRTTGRRSTGILSSYHEKNRLGQRYSFYSLTLSFYFYKNIYQKVVYVYFYKNIFKTKLYSCGFYILKLNNLKVI